MRRQPIAASSGKTHRLRLNRGGDRQANAALYRITLSRLRWDERTRDYLQRRIPEGKTRRKAIRCLKRYIAHEVYRLLRPLTAHPTTPPRLDIHRGIGLTGFPEAIEATWPQTTVQTCTVHLIRAAMRFVPDKDRKKVATALKRSTPPPPSKRPRPSW